MTEVRLTRLNVWKIIPMPERSSRNVRLPAPRTSTPSTRTDPAVMGTKPLMARNNVDLPAPESPTITRSSPSPIVSETFLRAFRPPG